MEKLEKMEELKEIYKQTVIQEMDKNSGYYVELEEFERVNPKAVKNGYKRRDGVNLPDIIRNLSLVKNLELRDGDVFSIGFPKSGTTWVEEIVWLLLNDFNYDLAKKMHHYYRVIILDTGHSKKRLAELPSPRMFKSHLQLKFLPEDLTKRAKVVYVLRNPKDVVASSFKFFSTYLKNQFIGTMDELVDMFVEGQTMYGAWYEHVNAYTSLPGVYVVHYEDLVEDPYNEIAKIAKYLGKEPTHEQLTTLLEYISFDSLKNNESCALNSPEFFSPEMVFFNQGKIGTWKSCLSEEMSRKIDEMMEKKVTYKRPIQFEPKKKEQ